MTETIVRYHLSGTNLTVLFDDGARHIATDTDAGKAALTLIREAGEAGVQPDMGALRDILDPARRLHSLFDGTEIEVGHNGVMVRGRRIMGHLEKLLLDVASNGLDLLPWKRFVSRVLANPLESAREELDLFLSVGNLPITTDGHFLAYKRVNEDYTDCHSGRIDNSVGQTVTMPGGRSAVDANRNRTCSRGLHFCSQDYLKNFLPGRGRIVVLKIDPADVVSIPADYNNTKGRCWRYVVVDEISLTTEQERAAWGIIEDRYDAFAPVDYFDAADDDGWDDDYWDDVTIPEWEDDTDPEPQPTGFWSRVKDRLGRS